MKLNELIIPFVFSFCLVSPRVVANEKSGNLVFQKELKANLTLELFLEIEKAMVSPPNNIDLSKGAIVEPKEYTIEFYKFYLTDRLKAECKQIFLETIKFPSDESATIALHDKVKIHDVLFFRGEICIILSKYSKYYFYKIVETKDVWILSSFEELKGIKVGENIEGYPLRVNFGVIVTSERVRMPFYDTDVKARSIEEKKLEEHLWLIRDGQLCPFIREKSGEK